MKYIKIKKLEGKYDLELWMISNEREHDIFVIAKRNLDGNEILKYTEILLELQD